MTGLKPRVRQTRNTSESNPDSQTEVRSYGFNTRPTSPAAPSPRTEVHPIRPWESDSTSGVRERSVDGSGITPGLSHHSSIQTPNDWTPAGLTRSGQGPTSGYLGSTSFSAIFDEKIDIVAAGEPNAISETHVECLSSQEHNVKIKEGAAVLAQLADFKHFEALIERWLEYGQALALVSADAPSSPPSSPPSSSTAFAVVVIAATLASAHARARTSARTYASTYASACAWTSTRAYASARALASTRAFGFCSCLGFADIEPDGTFH